jgi:hypothetical protein
MSLEARMARLEREIRRVEDKTRGLTTQIPTRFRKGGGSGGMTIETVDTFPAIPSSPTIIYFTGDSNLWWAGPGQTHWIPQDFTSYDGTVGEEA